MNTKSVSITALATACVTAPPQRRGAVPTVHSTRPHYRKVRRRIHACLLALLFSLCAPSVVWAIRHDWTPEERRCAESIGVQLDRIGPGASIRTLTWISHLVVRGHVQEIKHDITGHYLTRVYISVDSFLKGSYTSDTIVVNLLAGPGYSEHFGTISEAITHHEPSFTVGEEVLLFLDWVAPTDPRVRDEYRLGPGEYLPMGLDGKYLISEGVVTNWKFKVKQYPLDQVLKDIALTVTAQSTNCSANQ